MSTTGNTVRPLGKYFKSSFSGNPNGECVEACPLPGTVKIRDSKRKNDPGHPEVQFSLTAWSAFTTHLQQ
ncbi:DUF397 domain-containing protein [Streptomyces sp. 5.8]|uniref:DUF397 domain-containing protein n=1 Tax=Streptomyces sp. 5.8 TaxID=3406571 RepID=UPI003BB7611C